MLPIKSIKFDNAKQEIAVMYLISQNEKGIV